MRMNGCCFRTISVLVWLSTNPRFLVVSCTRLWPTVRPARGSNPWLPSLQRAEDVIVVLQRIDEGRRNTVEEVTLDLSDSMRKIVRSAFPKASRVIDRFHIQKLACDAVQELRIRNCLYARVTSCSGLTINGPTDKSRGLRYCLRNTLTPQDGIRTVPFPADDLCQKHNQGCRTPVHGTLLQQS